MSPELRELRIPQLPASMTKWDLIECGNTEDGSVPTLSQWGVAVLTLLLLTTGTILFKHRRVPSCRATAG
ncbi:MAG: IPTL-CTERM sorting domain-containing protein [Phycisphaerae bacterium]